MLSKSVKLTGFLVIQFAILYITSTLQREGASFFLSVFIVLEFLLGVGIFFLMSKEPEEQEEIVEHNSNPFQQQLEQIQYIQIDILAVLDQTDSRLAVIEEKLPKSRIRKLVHGTTSEHAAIPVTIPDDLTASTTSNGAETRRD